MCFRKEIGNILVNKRDGEELFKAINRLIESGWEDLVVSNRLFIERELDVRKRSQKLYQIYLNVLNQ